MEIRQCDVCKWYVGELKCLAFPGGIPKAILDGESHAKAVEGDRGYRFEKIQVRKKDARSN